MFRRGSRERCSFALGAALLIALWAAIPAVRAAPPSGRSAVASESRAATAAALASLRGGGNAIDAAVTAALVAGVTSPSSSGLGGGGFAVVWLAAERRAVVLDFREVAPAALDPAPFERRPLPPGERGSLVGVPGEARGLFELAQRFGRRPWREAVAPAARLAARGFAVEAHLGAVLASDLGPLRTETPLASVFFAGGRPAAVGAVVRNPDLGATLERLGAEGPSAFYEGPIAAELVRAAARAGGALSLADLAAYRAVERAPLHVAWEGYDVYTMPPPSAGGLLLAEVLGQVSAAELRRLGAGTGATTHLLAELMRGALADRLRYVGDPDRSSLDLRQLLDPARLATRRRSIAFDRTHAVPRFGLEGGGTHHLVTGDADGNFVSLTTTVNHAFGARLVAGRTGIVLDDQLDDFTAAADVVPFGLTASPNRASPGARPVSSMTPTVVVRDGAVVLALGGSGGPAIPTSVTQALLSRLIFATRPEEVVAAPRFYVPTRDATLWLEPNPAPALLADLRFRGEVIGSSRYATNAVQLIAVEQGQKLPAADPRKHGAVAAE